MSAPNPGSRPLKTNTRPLTLTDYAALDEPENEQLTELVAGVVVREPRPGRPHGRLQARLAYHLQRWAGAHGAEVTVESGFVLSEEPATVRGPDVAVVLDPDSDREEFGGWLHGAPDVAAEILSPSDTSADTRRKTHEYLDAGARLVWLVDPEARSVLVHRPDGSANLLGEDDTLLGEDVLTGFSLELAELFQ